MPALIGVWLILHYHIASIFHSVNSRAVFPNSARAGGIEINTIWQVGEKDYIGESQKSHLEIRSSYGSRDSFFDFGGTFSILIQDFQNKSFRRNSNIAFRNS